MSLLQFIYMFLQRYFIISFSVYSFYIILSTIILWWVSLTTLSCYHCFLHIFLVTQLLLSCLLICITTSFSLCWYNTSLPAIPVNNLTTCSPWGTITALPDRGRSGTSASGTSPPLALEGTEAPDWTGNVWHEMWCFHVALLRSCPRRLSPEARETGPWLVAPHTPGAPRYGDPERRRSPDTDSWTGQR